MSGPPVIVIVTDGGAERAGVGLCPCGAVATTSHASLGPVQGPPPFSGFELFPNMTGRDLHYIIMFHDLTQWPGFKVEPVSLPQEAFISKLY